jgi:hypothetical protein
VQSNFNTHANTFSDTNRERYADSDGNSNAYGYSELHAQAHSHAKTSAHGSTAPVVAPTVRAQL